MEINSTHPPVAGLGDTQRPGEYLRKIRQNRKLELVDVATALKIPQKQLNALENDDYRALPQAPFVRGYYRAYARFLNADEELVIQRFENVYSQDTGLTGNHALKDSPIKIMGHLSRSKRRGASRWLKRLLWLIFALGVAALLWLGLNKWMHRHTAELSSDSPNTTQNTEVVSSIANTTSNGASPISGDRLIIQFSRPTSVMISDATGKTLAQGRQDQTLNLHGESPFSIRIDDAAAAKLQLNNEVIDLSSYTKAAGNAEFKLSP